MGALSLALTLALALGSQFSLCRCLLLRSLACGCGAGGASRFCRSRLTPAAICRDPTGRVNSTAAAAASYICRHRRDRTSTRCQVHVIILEALLPVLHRRRGVDAYANAGDPLGIRNRRNIAAVAVCRPVDCSRGLSVRITSHGSGGRNDGLRGLKIRDTSGRGGGIVRQRITAHSGLALPSAGGGGGCSSATTSSSSVPREEHAVVPRVLRSRRRLLGSEMVVVMVLLLLLLTELWVRGMLLVSVLLTVHGLLTVLTLAMRSGGGGGGGGGSLLRLLHRNLLVRLADV